MKGRLVAGAALALWIAIPCALGAAAEKSRGVKTWSFGYQADTLGQEPEHSAVFGGRWEVTLGSTASDSAATDSSLAPRVLRQSETDDGIDFHYLQFKKPILEDLVASVRFRVLSGEIDPTAGLLFQLDPKGRNGYLLRVSGQKNRLIAHYLLYGKRRDIKWVDIPEVEPGVWHTLSLTRKGHMIVGSYDGVERLKIRDERYRKGNVGLWTEDDTVVEFSDLTVSNN